MICYVLAMGKQHLGPHVVVGYGMKIFWPGLFITSPDHLAVGYNALVDVRSCAFALLTVQYLYTCTFAAPPCLLIIFH